MYVLGEAETSDNGIILCDFGDSDVEIQLDYEKLTFDNAIERRFENGNYYINIYTDGSVYASTVYVNGECRIVCELGEGRVPALYHVPTDKTFVFDDELNDVASFDGENYVDLSTAVTYTDIIAGSYGTNGRIMLANGSIYQVEYNYHGCAEYSLDTSAQMVSDNLILVNSRYYFLLGDEYFALWGYQLGSISSSNAVSSVVARGSVGVYEESGNAYVDDKLTQKENAYYAVVVFEDNSVLAVVAWVAPSELYGETVEFIKLGGALVYADGGLAVFNEKNGITFVELGEDSVYARRTYYALSGAELVRQTNTNYYIKSGSKYYEFDVEFAFVRELTEQEFSQLSSD